MKFSFDFENYRKNLADELKKKRKESKENARNFLGDEKKTEKYNVAEEAKGIDFEIKKIKPDQKDKIKTLKSGGKYEVETIDIKDKIPENIRIFIDKRRIWETKYGELEEDVESENTIEAEELRPFSENEEAELKRLINEITENNFSDKNKLNTVIGAYRAIYGDRLITQTSGVDMPKERAEMIKKIRKERVKGKKYKIHIPYNVNQFNPKDLIWGRNAYFAAGDSHWLDPVKTLVICDPFSERFQKKANFVRPYFQSQEYQGAWVNPKHDSSYDPENLPRARSYAKNIEYASRNTEGGINITFKEMTKWIDIAEWIVDLPNGKIYKITEKEKTKKRIEKI